MKVLAFNGSPQMDRGNTALILNPFLQGMQQAGAEVEVLYTRKLRILPCLADFSCIYKTPGRCVQKDDMNEIYPRVRQADVWVLASPVFWDGFSAPLKSLLDRLVPIGSAGFELRDGHSRHPLGADTKPGKLVLVATCGFWELDNFDPMLVHARAISRNTQREFAGALLRPHGPVLAQMARAGAPVGDIFDAARDAGRQLAQNGAMEAATLAAISRPLLPLESYIEGANRGVGAMLHPKPGV